MEPGGGGLFDFQLGSPGSNLQSKARPVGSWWASLLMPTPGEQKTIFDPQAVRLRGAAVHLSRSPPRGLRRAKETRVKPERLSREDLLLLKDGHCLRDHALAV